MKKKFSLIIVMITVLMLGVVIGVGAQPITENIKAQMNWGMKFKVHGENWEAKDQNNKKIAPIVYQGTTYVPLRAVSNSLNTAVTYDSPTKTIYLGEKPTNVSLTKLPVKMEKRNENYVTSDDNYVKFEGVNYESGILFRDHRIGQSGSIVSLDGKYQNGEFTVIFLGEEVGRVDIRFIDGDTGVGLGGLEVSSDNSVNTTKLELGGVKNLHIVSSSGSQQPVLVTGKLN